MTAVADENTPSAPRFAARPRAILAVFALISAVLIAGYFAFLRVDYAVLYANLKPSEASAIVEQLEAKGISHRIGDGGATVLVPTNAVDTTKVTLAGTELPMKGSVGFELFNKSDMGLTDFAQKINYQRALQGELARTIMMMDGIETARIHLAIPERSLFRGNQGTPKAAVEVISQPGRPLSPDRVAGIQQLVAAAVPELPAGGVVVLDSDGQILSNVDAGLAQTPEVEERIAAQNYYSARAKSAITALLPGLNVAVRTLAIDGGAAGLTAGSPSANKDRRNFALRIVVLTVAALNAEDQGIAQRAIADAVGFDSAQGDSISFEVGPTSPATAAPLPSAMGNISVPDEVVGPTITDPESQGVGPWMLGALALGAAAIALMLLRKRQPALSVAERDAFVERLRTHLLTSRVSDAAE